MLFSLQEPPIKKDEDMSKFLSLVEDLKELAILDAMYDPEQGKVSDITDAILNLKAESEQKDTRYQEFCNSLKKAKLMSEDATDISVEELLKMLQSGQEDEKEKEEVVMSYFSDPHAQALLKHHQSLLTAQAVQKRDKMLEKMPENLVQKIKGLKLFSTDEQVEKDPYQVPKTEEQVNAELQTVVAEMVAQEMQKLQEVAQKAEQIVGEVLATDVVVEPPKQEVELNPDGTPKVPANAILEARFGKVKK